MFALNLKRSAFAFAALVLSGGVAAAAMAVPQAPLNVRAGKGTGYAVVGTMPPGVAVNAVDCGGGWCFIPQYGGYASASYLAFRVAGGPPPGYVGPPPAVYVGAAAVTSAALLGAYPYYWGGYYGPWYGGRVWYGGRPWYGPRPWYGRGWYGRPGWRGGPVYRGAAYRGGYRAGFRAGRR